MEPRAPYVSVIDPISPAFERVKTVLFRPFDLGRWFVIGFCAWLALLGEAGGGGGGGGGRAQYNTDRSQVQREIEDIKEFVGSNLNWIVPVAVVAIAVIIGLWLLALWLSSRGRFMFLYCVAQNKAEVKNPWHQFRGHGNSLFVFRVVLGLITAAALVVPLVLGGIAVATSSAAFGFNALSIIGIVVFAMFFAAILIVSALVGKFTKDFAVPIMYLHAISSVDAWRVLLDLLAENKARFFLYLLVQIVIAIAIGATVLVSICCTCCCAACVFAVPYIGTVILLPVHVFIRSYSLYYLAQYAPQFNVFAPPPASTPTAGPSPA